MDKSYITIVDKSLTKEQLLEELESERITLARIQIANAKIIAKQQERINALNDHIRELSKENRDLSHPRISKSDPTIKQLRAALKRAVKSSGHDHNCSAVQGMDSDCHCGWVEIRNMV